MRRTARSYPPGFYTLRSRHQVFGRGQWGSVSLKITPPPVLPPLSVVP
jgi:hypothetical protein